jgi:hypothetical protein
MDSKDSKNNIKKYVTVSGPNGFILPDPRDSPFFIKKLERAIAFMKNNPVPIEFLRTK